MYLYNFFFLIFGYFSQFLFYFFIFSFILFCFSKWKNCIKNKKTKNKWQTYLETGIGWTHRGKGNLIRVLRSIHLQRVLVCKDLKSKRFFFSRKWISQGFCYLLPIYKNIYIYIYMYSCVVLNILLYGWKFFVPKFGVSSLSYLLDCVILVLYRCSFCFFFFLKKENIILSIKFLNLIVIWQ